MDALLFIYLPYVHYKSTIYRAYNENLIGSFRVFASFVLRFVLSSSTRFDFETVGAPRIRHARRTLRPWLPSPLQLFLRNHQFLCRHRQSRQYTLKCLHYHLHKHTLFSSQACTSNKVRIRFKEFDRNGFDLEMCEERSEKHKLHVGQMFEKALNHKGTAHIYMLYRTGCVESSRGCLQLMSR